MIKELSKAGCGKSIGVLCRGLDPRNTLKHERAEQAIERLGEVLYRLECLSSRISSEPSDDLPEFDRQSLSLEEHLRAAPERIECFIGAAESLIEQIEEKLF